MKRVVDSKLNCLMIAILMIAIFVVQTSGLEITNVSISNSKSLMSPERAAGDFNDTDKGVPRYKTIRSTVEEKGIWRVKKPESATAQY